MDGVVAVVNGVGISEELFNEFYGVQSGYLVMSGGEDALDEEYMNGISNREQMMAQVLTQIILTELYVQAAKREGIEVKVEEVNAEVEKNIASMGGENALTEIGISKETYLKTAIEAKYTDEFFEKILESIKVNEEDIEIYFDEHRVELEQVVASHILVGSEDEASNIIERLNAGENFTTIADDLSTDRGTAQFGGGLGSIKRNMVIQEFEEVIFEAGLGLVSQPVKTRYGHHVVKINEIKKDIESLRDDIVGEIKSKHRGEFLRKLKDEADVEIIIDIPFNWNDMKSDSNGIHMITGHAMSSGHGTSAAVAPKL